MWIFERRQAFDLSRVLKSVWIVKAFRLLLCLYSEERRSSCRVSLKISHIQANLDLLLVVPEQRLIPYWQT